MEKPIGGLVSPKGKTPKCSKISEQARRPHRIPPSRWPGSMACRRQCDVTVWASVSQTWVQISSLFTWLCDFSEPWFPPLFSEVCPYLIKFHSYLKQTQSTELSALFGIHMFSENGSFSFFSFNSPSSSPNWEKQWERVWMGKKSYSRREEQKSLLRS